MLEAMSDTEPADLDLLLRPHRSLSPTGFWVIMTILAVWSFVGGIVFLSIGAWPVIGFVGVDVLLVWIAFKASYGTRTHERLRLAGGRLTIDGIDRRGRRTHHEMPSYWTRVTLEEITDSNRLVLSSHGRHVAVGSFLSPGEREEIAVQIRDALARSRATPA